MRGKNLLLTCLAAMLLSAPLVVNVSFALPDPMIFISPDVTQTSSGQYFTIEVYLMDAVGVAAYEYKIAWDFEMTEFPPETAQGGFFPDSGYDSSFIVQNNLLYKYVMVGSYLLEPGSVTGEGSLASMTFKVKLDNSGTSMLHLFDTKLWDEDGDPITHTTADGSFYTTNPKVIFSWTPEAPIAGELVTFDGTASYDPDGGSIVYYEWDFGDGSPTETGAIVTHTYADYQYEPYIVKLSVTDDESETWFLEQELQIWRDLAIVSVWPSMDEFDNTHYSGYQTYVDYYMDMPGLLWMLVTVVNFGTVAEEFHVDVYMDADTTVIGDEFAFVDVYDFDPGIDWAVNPGAGTGFGLMFLLDVSYGAQQLGTNDPVPPGQYTITAIMTTDVDMDLSTNMMQCPFGLHGSVELTRMVRGATTDRVYKMKHGPIVFGGFIKNFDNTYDILRAPDDQGEYAVLVLDIMDESGEIVAHLESDVVYLDYLEENLDQLTLVWSDLAVGTYTGIASTLFGTDAGYLPYWGENVVEFNFAVIP